MSKSDQWESDLLKLYLQNVAAAGIGDAGGLQPSAVAGSVYVALHTADPGEAGTQATSEATYTGYARQAVVRSAVGWTVSGTAPSQGVNAGAITFPACTAGGDTLTHFSVGDSASGATKYRYSGAITGAPVVVSTVNTPPTVAAGALVITED
jgi:hypothetical protein